MRKVEVDEEVWAAVKAEAEPLEDDFNAVLRRRFGLDPAGVKGISGRRRAAPGSLLAFEEYEQPVLQALCDADGRGGIRDIVDSVGEALSGRLTDEDLKPLPSGKYIRWRNRAAWMYQRLKDRGLTKSEARGIWGITEDGRRRLEELRRQRGE